MSSQQNKSLRFRASLQHARCWRCLAGFVCLIALSSKASAQSTAQAPPPLTEIRTSAAQQANPQQPVQFAPLSAPTQTGPSSSNNTALNSNAGSGPQLRISAPRAATGTSNNPSQPVHLQPVAVQPIAVQPPAMPSRTMNVAVSQPASAQPATLVTNPAAVPPPPTRTNAAPMQVAISPGPTKSTTISQPTTTAQPTTNQALRAFAQPSRQYATLQAPPANPALSTPAQTASTQATPASAPRTILPSQLSQSQPAPSQSVPSQSAPSQSQSTVAQLELTPVPPQPTQMNWVAPQNSPSAQAARLRAAQLEQLQAASVNDNQPRLLVAQNIQSGQSGQIVQSGQGAAPAPIGGMDPQAIPAFGPGSVDYGQSIFNEPGVLRSSTGGGSGGVTVVQQPAAESQLDPSAPNTGQLPPAQPAFANTPAQQDVQHSIPTRNVNEGPTRNVNEGLTRNVNEGRLPTSPSPLIIEVPQPMVFGANPPIDYSVSDPALVNVAGASWIFNFQDAPWSLVLKNFARHSGMSLQVEQFPPGTFTYYDDRAYEFTESLDVINDHLLAQGYLLVRNENKLTALATNSPLREGVVPFVPLRAIAILGRNELVSVAFPVAGAGLQAVPEVQQLLSPIGKVQALSNSNRLIVTDTGASLRRLRDLLSGSGLAANEVEQFVIHLRNTKAEEVASSINQRLNRTGAGSSAGGVVQASATSPTGPMSTMAVVPEKQTNSLLVEGTPEEFARIEALVRLVDRDPAQVVIQALLVEVELGNSRETGVELGFQDSVLFDRSVIDNIVSVTQTSTAANGVQTTNQNVVSQTAAPGFNFNGAPLGNNTTIRPSTVGRQGTSNLGLGRVSSDLGFGGLVLSAGSNSVNVLLRALAANHKLDVLSRPQIRTLNNKEALIQIGQQVPIVEGVSVTTNGNANPIIRQDKAGIILKVTPRIADDGLVQIDVHAEKSAYNLTPGSGVPIFTDATRGNVVEAPVKDITTAETTVSAFSGQTVVLGGMITRDQTEVHRRVPFLSDIPLLGRLFRVDLSRTNRKELLIFLTPVVVNAAGESDCMAAEEAGRMHVTIDPNVDLHRDFLQIMDTEKLQPVFPTTEIIGPGLIEEAP